MLIFVCLLDDLILGFYYNNMTLEFSVLELASTITLEFQAHWLSKRASHMGTFSMNFWITFQVAISGFMNITEKKMKLSIKFVFGKGDQIHCRIVHIY